MQLQQEKSLVGYDSKEDELAATMKALSKDNFRDGDGGVEDGAAPRQWTIAPPMK